jgi:SprT-like family
MGLPPVPRVVTHRNRAVMVSWFPGRELRIHEGYAHAPDFVLSAIIRFLAPGVRREARLAARHEFLAFPVEDHAPTVARTRGREATAQGDQPLVTYFSEMHARLNQEHFAGALSPIPIRISRRMKRRLGEVRLDRRTGAAVEISLSRRHVRRDGWREAEHTLLHEMIHQWQAENGQPVDHGKGFRRWARELGIHPRAVRH